MTLRRRTTIAERSVILQQTLAAATVFLLAGYGAAVAEPGTASPSAMTMPITVTSFLSAFVIVTFVLFLLLRSRGGIRFFSYLFGAAILSGIWTLSYSVFGKGAAIAMVSVAVLSYAAFRTVLVFDVLVIVGVAGVAAMFGGAMNPTAVTIIIGILALYDVIAVYGTKHMAVMGKELLGRSVPFGLIFPSPLSGLFSNVRAITKDKGRYVFLGTGDLVLPALLVASVARYGLIPALGPAVGAVVGTLVSMGLFLRFSKRTPMPALPPIALGAILGYVVTNLL